MRILILAAAAVLTLSACNKTDSADNSLNVDENLFASETASNDTTAIDAVTNDAANMAADVNYANDIEANDMTANKPSTAPRKSGGAAANSSTNNML